jgi:formylglycine-generating enzyme required for sulfatase activity
MVAEDDGHHERRVYLGAFAIDRLEVTVADYRACVSASACPIDPLVAGDERYIRDEWPLVNVTWDEAQLFCRWRGGRLPTEAEWERAARGDGDASAVWPWCERDRRDSGNQDKACVPRPGDFNHGQPRSRAMRDLDRGSPGLTMLGDLDDSDSVALLAPPGAYPWNEGPYGTRDQSGNVAEWTADVCAGCSSRRADHDTWGYDGLSTINPVREGGQQEPRVVRGGSWRQPAFLGRIDVRDPFNFLYLPFRRFSHVGFRCARDLGHR